MPCKLNSRHYIAETVSRDTKAILVKDKRQDLALLVDSYRAGYSAGLSTSLFYTPLNSSPFDQRVPRYTIEVFRSLVHSFSLVHPFFRPCVMRGALNRDVHSSAVIYTDGRTPVVVRDGFFFKPTADELIHAAGVYVWGVSETSLSITRLRRGGRWSVSCKPARWGWF